ncbi:hypothetical protein GCM10018793_52380 [Streptomyces sulfonofaciens]|uniref:Asp23/Gls24 family envelope stress response protein n=1 Tax=Streptomyces sulfonofaciens TaxID=68272 RepID=A0A919GI64_9ACTN|nr:Asp23/Gls24 family envelope stress response protein [Streptomyces sulfonofaciens]GHH85222.1 hypothetical protein GCM10018793_52380 [Streptomyces sulfonofaciens]
MTPHDTRQEIERTVAAAAGRVPGVASLSPRLPRLLRDGTARFVRAAGRGEQVPGVHARLDTDRHTWHVEVKVTTLSGHRALDVTRAVRAAADGAAHAALHGARDAVAVTVTVTAVV